MNHLTSPLPEELVARIELDQEAPMLIGVVCHIRRERIVQDRWRREADPAVLQDIDLSGGKYLYSRDRRRRDMLDLLAAGEPRSTADRCTGASYPSS